MYWNGGIKVWFGLSVIFGVRVGNLKGVGNVCGV